jgi:hypothetical protein
LNDEKNDVQVSVVGNPENPVLNVAENQESQNTQNTID